MENSFIESNVFIGTIIFLIHLQTTSGFVCAGENTTSKQSLFQNVPINCISYDFLNITCRWTLPAQQDVLHTNWKFIQKNKIGHDRICPDPISNYTKGCTFLQDFTASPKLCFVLIGINPLSRSESWYSFDHFLNVILSPPVDLHYTNVTNSAALISWEDNSKYKDNVQNIINVPYYKASVDYEINFKRIHDAKDNIRANLTSGKSYPLTNLNAFTDYDVEVRCQFVVQGHRNAWSRSVRGTFKTLPSVPSMPPSTILADVTVGMRERSITLYWPGVPKDQQFGKNFHYTISMICNNSESVLNSTTNTYFTQSGLSITLDYIFKVQATNEVGHSEEGTYLHMAKNDSHKLLGLEVDDVILYDNKTGVWNYNVSWKVADEKLFNLSLYWCRGTKDVNELIKCDEDGIKLQNIFDNKTSSLINLHNPFPLHHFFGVAATMTTTDRRMAWSPCVVPTSRVPNPPHFSSYDSGTTWVYLSWKNLECTEKAAFITGFKLYVYQDDKEITGYSVRENITSYNVTQLLPNTKYVFALTTRTITSESDPKKKEVTTREQEIKANEVVITVVATIISIIVVGGMLSWIGYVLHKRIRSKVEELTTIQLPDRLTDYYEGITTDGIVNRQMGYPKLPLLSSGKASEWTGNVCNCQDVGENGELAQALTNPPDDDNNTSVDSGILADVKEISSAQVNDYVLASVLDRPSSSLEPPSSVNAVRERHQSPTGYSSVGRYVASTMNTLPCNSNVRSDISENRVPNYVRVVGFDLTESSTDGQEDYHHQHSSPTGLEVSDVNVCALHTSEFSKGGGTTTSNQDITLNSAGSVCYARLSVAVEPHSSQDDSDRSQPRSKDKECTQCSTTTELSSSQKTSVEPQLHATEPPYVQLPLVDEPSSTQNKCDELQVSAYDKKGYMKVCLASDESEKSHQLKSHAASSGGRANTGTTIELQITQPSSNLTISGYKRIGESNLASSCLVTNNNSLDFHSPSDTTCHVVDGTNNAPNVNIVLGECISTQLPSHKNNRGYVSAANLSSVFDCDAQSNTSQQPCKQSSLPHCQLINNNLCSAVARLENAADHKTVVNVDDSTLLPSITTTKGYVPAANVGTLLRQDPQNNSANKCLPSNHLFTNNVVNGSENTVNPDNTVCADMSTSMNSSSRTKGYVPVTNASTLLIHSTQIAVLGQTNNSVHTSPTNHPPYYPAATAATSYVRDKSEDIVNLCTPSRSNASVSTSVKSNSNIPKYVPTEHASALLVHDTQFNSSDQMHLGTRNNSLSYCQAASSTVDNVEVESENTANVNNVVSADVPIPLDSSSDATGYVPMTNAS